MPPSLWAHQQKQRSTIKLYEPDRTQYEPMFLLDAMVGEGANHKKFSTKIDEAREMSQAVTFVDKMDISNKYEEVDKKEASRHHTICPYGWSSSSTAAWSPCSTGSDVRDRLLLTFSFCIKVY